MLDEQNVWASGTGGTVVNSNDGGQNWRVILVPGAEELDFRDIHAVDKSTVIAMTAGTPARIYRTVDAGKNWTIVFESNDERVFFDAISFFDSRRGIAMSDPVDGRLFLLTTADGGMNWEQLENAPKTNPGEGGFAASGTNMTIVNDDRVMIAWGSGVADQPPQSSRAVFSNTQMKEWKEAAVPMRRHPSAGIFSIAFTGQTGVAVGGDYKQPDAIDDNFAVTRDGGVSWQRPKHGTPPSGYRSGAAAWIRGTNVTFVAVGPNGTDVSNDQGEHWIRVSDQGFHAIQFSGDGEVGWATGSDGRIAKWVRTD